MSDQTPEPRLKFFPVSFFSMIMGLTGLSIAWHNAETAYGMTLKMSGALLALAAVLFVVLSALYVNKLLRFRDAVIKELAHPIQLNFFPTISISLLLLGIAALNHWPGAAGVLWVLGTALHLLFTLYVMGVWIHHEHFEIHHINPAWFIPVVGNVLVPIAGVPLGFQEVSWFFFSIGMLFWLVLFAIIMYRVLFHHPLPERLMPTFFILIAPPAVGFVAYMQLTGELDPFARILYYSGLFLTLLLITQVGRFVRLEFYLSWWAYSFPLAAITVASLIMFQQTRLVGFAAIGWALLTLVTLVVFYLLYRTALAVASKKICIPAV
ncbi:MAG: SLAC1 anion channel family protein [Pseudomonadota bacterium]|nr:SLAC1 anion channel family protein [Pseudomonadota bacterium]